MNIRSLLLIGLFLLHGAQVIADDGCCSCPECGHKVCVAKPVTKTTKKTVFNVEKKDICIPRFRFPWQMRSQHGRGGCDQGCCDQGCDSNGQCQDCGCAPKCGRVKTVKVLKKKSIECKKCGYEWEIKTVDTVPCDRFGLRRGCNGPACDSSMQYFSEHPEAKKK